MRGRKGPPLKRGRRSRAATSLCTLHPAMAEGGHELGPSRGAFRVRVFQQVGFRGQKLTSPAEGGSFRSSPSSQPVRQLLSTHPHHPARPSYRCRTRLMAEKNNPLLSDSRLGYKWYKRRTGLTFVQERRHHGAQVTELFKR